MKLSIKFSKLFFFLLFVSQTSLAQIVHSSYVPAGYNLVFNDEFENPRAKFVNWKPDNRDGRGDEWKNYATIESGVMKLKNLILPDLPGGRKFTAPSCSGIRYYKYGYFECRYKYAASTGFNNSFWLLGNPQLSKDYVEIDINEGQVDEGGQRNKESWLAAGGLPTLDQVRPLTLDHSSSYCNKARYFYTNEDLSADFHTYAFLWTPDTLSYYFDGILLLKHPNRRIVGNEPQYRLLNYPMNIYLSTLGHSSIFGFDKAVESSMDIDYVRVYQLPGSTDGTPPTSGVNLLKNPGFGPFDVEEYGGPMYSWNSGVGNIDSTFYSSTVTEARTSPLYMPNQNINVLPAGDYNLTFRARVFDATANTASLRLKISNSDNLSTSMISKLTAISGGGGVSGSEVVITKVHAPVFKDFTYRFTVATTSRELPLFSWMMWCSHR